MLQNAKVHSANFIPGEKQHLALLQKTAKLIASKPTIGQKCKCADKPL